MDNVADSDIQLTDTALLKDTEGVCVLRDALASWLFDAVVEAVGL